MGSILDYFEETVTKYPNKKAISNINESLDFCELKDIAQKCAYIISKIGKNKPVGIFTNRDIHSIVWFIGTMYSHNFYVPIDPDLPIDKIQHIIDDAGFEIIIGNDENFKKIKQLDYQKQYVTMDNLTESVFADTNINSSDPIYMVYTSGSTGKPKGVLKSHGSICNFIKTYCQTFDFVDHDIIGNQTPFFFDAAAKDLYLMMYLGTTIEIIPTEIFSMTTQLIEFMNEKKISFISWVPTALSLVAQMCPFSLVKPQYLRKVFFVGEVMPMKHLNKWRKTLPDIEYVNLYGQSEIAGVCCYYIVDGIFNNNDILPIGKPLKNCEVLLVDKDLIVTETNHIGEIYISSDALATEYYNDDNKTKSSFIEKDFGVGLKRYFKTGDLAQYDVTGNLIFSSRSDYQIKHMGRRIELGEIEVVAGSIPEIDRCCCLYNQERKKIVLFCQLADNMTFTGQEIQSKLRKIITNYMLPNKIVILDNLPINANGKIDRQQLKNYL